MITNRNPVGQKRTMGAGKRVYVNLPISLARAVKQEAAARRVPQASIIEATLRDRYDPENADMRDRILTGELRGIRREMGQLQFQQRALAEVLAVAVKNIIATLPPPTKEGHTRAVGFYNFLATQVEKALASDSTLVDRLVEKILTFGEEDFADLAGGPPPSHPDDENILDKTDDEDA